MKFLVVMDWKKQSISSPISNISLSQCLLHFLGYVQWLFGFFALLPVRRLLPRVIPAAGRIVFHGWRVLVAYLYVVELGGEAVHLRGWLLRVVAGLVSTLLGALLIMLLRLLLSICRHDILVFALVVHST